MTPDKYPFEEIKAELQKDPFKGDPGSIPGDPRIAMMARVAKGLEGAPELPEDAIPANAKLALEKADGWKQDPQVPAAGKDGRVVYTFGAGLATVICAPLRVCVLELQPGEQVVGEPHIGDSVRWSIAPAVSGAGNAVTNMVIIKPKEAGLDTNLVIPTNRRVYYIRLVSRQQEYLPLVAFAYPDDDLAKWKQTAAAQDRTREEFEASQLTPVDGLSNLHFDYQVTGGSQFLRPVRVVDDGKKTYIQMPDGTAVREAPILVVSGLDSTAEMVNYRVKGNMYIVDRLFEHGALLLGSGKKQERVDIVRGGTTPAKVSRSGKWMGKKEDAIEQAYLQARRTPAVDATPADLPPEAKRIDTAK
jgi:type IV secretion system protein VirB9